MAIEATRRILGDRHDLLAVTLVDQGMLLHFKGDYGAAERVIRQTIELGARIHGPRHPREGLHKTILGMVLADEFLAA